MASKRKKTDEKGSLELIDEVFHLVRTAPPTAFVFYYLGTLPFVLGLLYFWADMGRSAYAHTYLARGSFGLALLFVWMKTWQVFYARRLHAEVCGKQPPRLSLLRMFRVAARQTIIQPSGFFVLPIALGIAVPFGWVYAFYQNVTVLDGAETDDAMSLVQKAGRLSRLWPRQNHIVIWALSPFLLMVAAALFLVAIPVAGALTPEWTAFFLGLYSIVFLLVSLPLSPFGIIVASNIAIALLLVPQLLKMLLGIETIFLTGPQTMLNTTFVAVVCGLTYLCMDPLLKAAYVLRCFYGESLHTGEDLRVELRRLTAGSKYAVVSCVALAGVLFSHAAVAEEYSQSTTAQTVSIVSPAELDAALDLELQDRHYTWRMPRIQPEESEESLFAAFMRGIFETVAGGIKKMLRWLEKIADWLADRMPKFGPRDSRKLSETDTILRFSLYALLTALAFAVIYMLWRSWRHRRIGAAEVVAESITASPDLEDEHTMANEFPEETWLTLARDLREKGEFRLALRAVFLASLAHLAHREFIQLARFKSNRDYQKELGRHTHTQPGLFETFSRSVAMYESVWYGVHETTADLLDSVIANQETIRDFAYES